MSGNNHINNVGNPTNKQKSQFYGCNDTIFMTRHASVWLSVCLCLRVSGAWQSNCLSKHKTLQMRQLREKEETNERWRNRCKFALPTCGDVDVDIAG